VNSPQRRYDFLPNRFWDLAKFGEPLDFVRVNITGLASLLYERSITGIVEHVIVPA
jgi:hypothetical protein